MKFSKELEERIDKAIEEFEIEEAEGKMKFYEEDEAFAIMFGESYIGKKV